MHRPHLMHVVTGLGTGGTEMMCLRLARHWQGRFDQSVIALSVAKRALEANFRELSNLTLMIAPVGQDDVRRWKWLRGTIRARTPDALLIHTFGRPHLLAAHAARTAGVRRIAAAAGNPPPEAPSARRTWKGILMASRFLGCPIISCSRAVDRELRNLGVGVPWGSVPIPNAIDGALVAPGNAPAHGRRPGSKPVIGMVARLNKIKDHETLLRAFAVLRRGGSDADLWIVGDGHLRRYLEARAEELAIASSVKFFGERIDANQLLSQMDVYAFSTTRDEGFGIALIEAMAARIPIVATDVSACREVLAGGAAGCLVPPGDAAAMAAAIAELLKNDRLRFDLVEAARNRVQQEYSIAQCAERWERVLFPALGSATKHADCRCVS